MTTFDVRAHLEGSWWVLEAPELGAVSQSEHHSRLETDARDLVAVWLDVDPHEIEVEVTVKVTALAVRCGEWWAVEVPELGGVHTQARRWDEIPAQVDDLAKLLGHNTVDVEVKEERDRTAKTDDIEDDWLPRLDSNQEPSDCGSQAPLPIAV